MSLVHLHLLMNHIPVIGILFVAIVLIAGLRMRSSDMAKLGLVMLTGVAAISAVVYFTGEPAEDAVEKLAGVSRAVIRSHEEAAELAFISAAIAGVLGLAALWAYRKRALPRWTTGAALAVVLCVSALMGWTANLGGRIRHSEIRGSSTADGSVSTEVRDEH